METRVTSTQQLTSHATTMTSKTSIKMSVKECKSLKSNHKLLLLTLYVFNSLKKYASLIKNVHFYLCYLFLETTDYINAIKHGQILLEKFGDRLTKKTKFTCLQYLSEAYTMEGNFDKALNIIDESAELIDEEAKREDSELKLTVETLTQKLI